MANSYLSTFLHYLQSDATEFQIAQRAYFLVHFHFNSGTPSFEKNLPEYFNQNGDLTTFNSEMIPFLVQAVDLPKLSISGGSSEGEGYSIVNFEGQAKGPGKFVVLPDGAKSVDIKFLDTETPIFENYFHPWMEEVTSFQYVSDKPFSRADIVIDLLSNDMTRITTTYRIIDAYPHSIELPDLKHTASQLPTRTVTFDFNNLKIKQYNGFGTGKGQVLPDKYVQHICNTLKLGRTRVERNQANLNFSKKDDSLLSESFRYLKEQEFYSNGMGQHY